MTQLSWGLLGRIADLLLIFRRPVPVPVKVPRRLG